MQIMLIRSTKIQIALWLCHKSWVFLFPQQNNKIIRATIPFSLKIMPPVVHFKIIYTSLAYKSLQMGPPDIYKANAFFVICKMLTEENSVKYMRSLSLILQKHSVLNGKIWCRERSPPCLSRSQQHLIKPGFDEGPDIHLTSLYS